MSRRRRQTHGDMVRDIIRRRKARKQQQIRVAALQERMREGHSPLCAVHFYDTGKCRCEESRQLGWEGNNEG